MSKHNATAAKRKILRRRARALADETRATHEAHECLEVVEIRLAHERYAVESAHVREVLPVKNIASLPCTPPFVLGLINVRGQILSVIDLRVFFDLPRDSATTAAKVLVLKSGEMEVGIVVDAVVEARSIALAEIRPTLPTMTGIREAFVRGIAEDDLIVLDTATLLADKSIVVNEQVEGVVR